jgi:hypothetical protein
MKPVLASTLVVALVLLGAVAGIGLVEPDGDAAIHPDGVWADSGDTAPSAAADQRSGQPANSDAAEPTSGHDTTSSTSVPQRVGSTAPGEHLQSDDSPTNESDGSETDDESDGDDESEIGEDDDESDEDEESETEDEDADEEEDGEADGDDGPWWRSGDEETPTPTPTPPESGPGTGSETPSPATFQVVDASLERGEVRSGEPIVATATVENRGGRADTYEAELRVDGETVATETVRVGAGDHETVTLRTRLERPGTYGVSVGDADAGTVSVARPDRDVLEVENVSLPADVVQPGVETTVRATVENPSDRAIDLPVNVTVDGETVAEGEVALDAGERRTVAITFEASAGTVAVGGVEAGRLRADQSVGGDGPAQPTPNEGAGFDVGFGFLAAAILVAGALLVAGSVRWRSDDSMLGNLEERRR